MTPNTKIRIRILLNSQDIPCIKIYEATIVAEDVDIHKILLVLIIYLIVAIKTPHLGLAIYSSKRLGR